MVVYEVVEYWGEIDDVEVGNKDDLCGEGVEQDFCGMLFQCCYEVVMGFVEIIVDLVFGM